MEKIRNQSFPFVSLDEWKERAEQSLKGKPVNALQNKTYENIILKPLYIRNDEQLVPDYPGGADFRRGGFPLGYLTNDWKVAQQIFYDEPKELLQNLKQAFEKGQTALSFDVSEKLLEGQNLSDLFQDVYKNFPFAINAKWLQKKFLVKLVEQLKDTAEITGYIAADPISLFAQEGFISEDLLHSWLEGILKAKETFPHLKTVFVDTAPYHNGGANAVQELGIAAAEGVFYLGLLMESGVSLEIALSKLQFHFSIGSNFFMELAKLRAARVIWNRITELYGVEEKDRRMYMSAETSAFNKTVFDPHVNLLRAGNEAFAAVLGGVQYLHVSPFDILSGANTFSERIARNIQLILKEEAHLKKVIDPAGGSWYIESLTHEVAEKAWELFQQIDAQGGILEVLKSGWIQEKIAAIYDNRNADIQTRKQSIIGTNVYAKLDENVPYDTQVKKYFIKEQAKVFTPILKKRLAEPYEELRFKAKRLEKKNGSTPSVGMLCLGELKQYKGRLDFMNGFLAAGGVAVQESKPILTVEDAKQFAQDLASPFVCFCGTNDQYETIGHEILTFLKVEFPEKNFFLAGLPEKENQARWKDEGIQLFIHIKSNCYETVSTLLASMEVNQDEESKA
ncbi:methylmalonyl-CoA mutase [Bacillus sp. BRMEA1]|uniref:methylmalonyl-CoA mutase subunit beta n=1 Tax=Neobacillus endophyticus TaxID=2738405 RepID=UPI001566BDFE|nr:methylmalonyl-CoA mutase subunit beta [Neobacillus endophyticus]NRD80680.1 methylmalonyl-CoA mutase [Neobacillus endophyticus]